MISINLKRRFFTSLFLIALFLLIIYNKILLVLSLILFAIYSLIEFNNLIKRIFLNKYFILISNLFFIFYIFLFSIFFFLFSENDYLKIILYLILTSCIASDIGGYVFGKYFKGPKLTRISPKKTISGSLGSIIFTSIVFFLYFYTIDIFSLKIILLSIIVSIGCQSGDLFFSYLKRKAKIKDTGNLFPGHGGILDRIDGILLGLPIGFLSLITLFK